MRRWIGSRWTGTGIAFLLWMCLAGLWLWAQPERQRQEEQAQETEAAAEIWQAFDLRELTAESSQASRPWLPFLRRSTLSMGVYRLKPGGRDGQSPHAQDEVYYVAEGKAVLQVGEDEIPVKAGSLVYLRAGAEHRFHSIEEELVVLVFFSAAEPPEAPKPRGSRSRGSQ